MFPGIGIGRFGGNQALLIDPTGRERSCGVPPDFWRMQYAPLFNIVL
jgi:hypothetical protein